jgi:SAM-dependent methyltransferase
VPPLFDGIAELYEQYAEINDEIYRPYLRGALPVHADRAVDLGCGSGRFTGLLAQRCDRVLAVDIAEREVRIARTKRMHPNLDYQVRDLLDVTPDVDGRFDVVFSVNTLFDLYADHGPDRVLRHLRSLVAPGGLAVIVDVVLPGRPTALRHRWWGVQDALKTLARRHSVRDAGTVLRLRQHPVWMTHVRVNQPISRAEFHHRHAEIFPGAEFTDSLDPFVCAARWEHQD